MKPALVALAAVTAVVAQAQPVYRTTDAAGHAVFLDRPVPGASPVAAGHVNTYAPPAAEPGPASERAPSASTERTPYESLEIVFPAPGATVRANGGNVRIEGRVVPGLAAAHRVVVSLDGDAAACAARPDGRFACALAAVARGPHTVDAAVLDEAGAVVLQAGVTRFQVLRTSVAARTPIARDGGMH